MKVTIKGVSKGDKFFYKNGTCEVTSVCNVVDAENNEIICQKCYARGVDTLAKNVFEVPFVTVKMHRVNE